MSGRRAKIWASVGGLFKGSTSKGYDAQAAIDLDVLQSHDEVSRLLVGVDLGRLERRNRERRIRAHQAIGDLHIEAGDLRWTPHRAERTCGVRPIEFKRGELRSIGRRTGAVIAVLKDGHNIPFVVQTQGVKAPSKRGIAGGKARRQEPPLIS